MRTFARLCAPASSDDLCNFILQPGLQNLQEWNMSGVQPLYPRCRCLQCQSKLHIPRDLWSRLGGHKERDRWTDRPADYLDLICLKWKDAPGFEGTLCGTTDGDRPLHSDLWSQVQNVSQNVSRLVDQLYLVHWVFTKYSNVYDVCTIV